MLFLEEAPSVHLLNQPIKLNRTATALSLMPVSAAVPLTEGIRSGNSRCSESFSARFARLVVESGSSRAKDRAV
jgi:hypothetical protein